MVQKHGNSNKLLFAEQIFILIEIRTMGIIEKKRKYGLIKLYKYFNFTLNLKEHVPKVLI